MTVSPKTYARALLLAMEDIKRGSEETVLRAFTKTIARKGERRRFGEILHEVEAALIRREGGRMIKIETARELKPREKGEIKSRFGAKDQLEIVIRPELIAGIRITIDGEEAIDNTLRRKLEKLFTG